MPRVEQVPVECSLALHGIEELGPCWAAWLPERVHDRIKSPPHASWRPPVYLEHDACAMKITMQTRLMGEPRISTASPPTLWEITFVQRPVFLPSLRTWLLAGRSCRASVLFTLRFPHRRIVVRPETGAETGVAMTPERAPSHSTPRRPAPCCMGATRGVSLLATLVSTVSHHPVCSVSITVMRRQSCKQNSGSPLKGRGTGTSVPIRREGLLPGLCSSRGFGTVTSLRSSRPPPQ